MIRFHTIYSPDYKYILVKKIQIFIDNRTKLDYVIIFDKLLAKMFSDIVTGLTRRNL